jgi:hypothetical protein
MTYDLHVHSCLSPCADDDMTPANIAGFARLNGIGLLAVADHNRALNLPAAPQACAAYGVRLLPAIEMNTAEEIHLLCYFAGVDAALEMGRRIWDALPVFGYDRALWGAQLVMDADDNVIARPQRLFTAACGIGLYAAKSLVEELGGIAVPAHVDREANSLLSILGFAPADLPFDAYEVRRPEHTLHALVDSGRLPAGQEILTSSDAHTLADIALHPRVLGDDSCLQRLLE